MNASRVLETDAFDDIDELAAEPELEKRLIRILGKKDVPGKPMIYGTTREFLELFGLPDLSSLPTLSEFSELIPEEERPEVADMPLLVDENDLSEASSETSAE